MSDTELFVVRVLAYSVLPLVLAGLHILLDPGVRTRARRIEVVMLYVLAISVGANGIGGAFGHLFLSDTVAASIGWEPGSPFQQEMGFANLALGVLGFLAIGRRGGFRLATIVAVTIVGVGATLVHLQDLVVTGNLAPGNTLQNVSNLLDPAILLGLTWLSARAPDADAGSAAFRGWQARQRPVAGLAAAGVGTGFGIGFALGALFVWTFLGALGGVALGLVLRRRIPETTGEVLP